ncbi:hypothetical protein [Jatrophihabitans sp.]|uniref:hypothetical protein n=1 Tax=Jatrophihabitans sp. TaxID=1932789 RepID=UPI0030C6AEA3
MSRAAERAARRQQRRDRVRLGIAGFCVTAGLILFVALQGSDGGGAAESHGASGAHRSGSAVVGSSLLPSGGSTPTPISTDTGAGTGTGTGTGAETAAETATALPIIGSGGPTDPGPAEFSSPTVVAAVLTAAKAGIVAVDSYDYRDLDAAIQRGLAVTTGDFEGSYRAAMTGGVAASAPVSHTVQTCSVQKIGITAVSADSTRASVLVFGELSTTDASTGSTPRRTAITLGVTLQHVSGSWLISAVSDFSTAAGKSQPPGTAALYDATLAGAQEVVDLLSFRRAHYDDDFSRALGGLTGPLLSEQQAQKTAILAAMTAANADYTGSVRCIGVVAAAGDSVTMLVAASSYQVAEDGTRTLQTLPRLELVVVRVGGAWLVDEFRAVSST